MAEKTKGPLGGGGGTYSQRPGPLSKPLDTDGKRTEREKEEQRAIAILSQLAKHPRGRAAIEEATVANFPVKNSVVNDALLKEFKTSVYESGSPKVGPEQMKILLDFIAGGGCLAVACDTCNLSYVDVARTIGQLAPERFAAAVEIRDAFRREILVDELFSMVRADISEVLDDNGNLKSFKDMPRHARKAIVSFDKTDKGERVRMASKLPVVKLLGSELGLFQPKDKEDHSVQLSSILEKLDEIKSKDVYEVRPIDEQGEGE